MAGEVMITIREEQSGDIPAIRRVNLAAFGQPQEADVVDQLRQNCDRFVSLVALDGDEIVGHVLFTPATIGAGESAIEGMGLAPLAVLPGRQRTGIGTALVEEGLATLRREGWPFVLVLGHPEYYPRFGFEPALAYGLHCQWDGVPEEAFMILVLDRAAMAGAQGVARYRSEFDAAMVET
jgi:putative acetyltransferase